MSEGKSFLVMVALLATLFSGLYACCRWDRQVRERNLKRHITEQPDLPRVGERVKHVLDGREGIITSWGALAFNGSPSMWRSTKYDPMSWKGYIWVRFAMPLDKSEIEGSLPFLGGLLGGHTQHETILKRKPYVQVLLRVEEIVRKPDGEE